MSTFVLADPHFGHQRMTECRPWATVEEHDEALIKNWNSVVHPKDRVYVLGDLSMNRRCIQTVGRCNGRKVLVKGNHDTAKLKDYTPYFDDVRACIVNKHGIIMSHIPIHPQSMGTRFKLNVHGHLHDYKITKQTVDYDPCYVQLDPEVHEEIDPTYRCVSMEQINYTPLNLEEIINGL